MCSGADYGESEEPGADNFETRGAVADRYVERRERRETEPATGTSSGAEVCTTSDNALRQYCIGLGSVFGVEILRLWNSTYVGYMELYVMHMGLCELVAFHPTFISCLEPLKSFLWRSADAHLH